MKQFQRLANVLFALLLAARFVCADATRTNGTILDGTPAATAYYTQDSGMAGPTVMITGGVHGDEPAGAYAAGQIRHWPITRGKIVIVPRANVVALAANKRNTPGEETALSNLNRDFPKAGEQGPAHGKLAEALWSLVQQVKPEWLLDLHEGEDFHQINGKSVGSSVIAFRKSGDNEAADLMLAAVNASITNQVKQFVRLGSPIDGSLARGAGEHLGVHAMILETTSKDQPLSKRARQHRVMVHTFLKYLGMIDESVTVESLTERGAKSRRTEVALFDAGGSAGQGVPRVVEILRNEKNVEVVQVGADEICHGALEQFNVVMFTGGSGSREAAAIEEAGREQVRRFIEAGGGYIGICAGAYLACSGFSWGLRILDAKTVSPKWARGHATLKIELTDRGRAILGDRRGLLDVRYANGPILMPAQVESLPDYEPLAFFRTEVAEHDTPKGVMINSPAIVAGRCGKGRVICSSPHPEQTEGLEEFVRRAVAWVTGQ